MNCLPCFRSEGKGTTDRAISTKAPSPVDIPKDTSPSSNSQTFTFRELAMATKNFRQECLLGEGGFGRVFKGKLHSTGQVVAVKQLDRNGMQGSKEFLVEVLMLSLLHHPNLVNLIGYCADGDQRLLVYEFMPMGSLEHHLFGDGPDKKPLDWVARMKIAAGAAKGLEYLHEKANPRVIYRDLKPSNILLDENFDTKLSDFGLAKLSPTGGKAQPASRVMGTYGYSAPEYSSSGELTLKSDVYNFGVVLLELITGRRVIDTTRPTEEQNLVTWAQPIFRDPKRFPDMADSRLNKHFPVTSLNQAVGIAAMCLQEDPSVRPLIGDVVAALSFISEVPNESIPPSVPRGDVPSKEHPIAFTPPPEQKMEYGNEVPQNCPTQPEKDYSDHSDRSSSDSEDGDDDRRSVDQHSEASCHTSDRHITNSDSSKHSDGESDGHSDGSNNSDGESIYHSDGPEVDDMDHNDAHLRQGSSTETKQGDVTLKQCSANTLSAYRLDMSSENGSGRKTGPGDVSSDHGSGCTLSDGFTSSSGHDTSRKSPANELGSSSKRCSRKKLEEPDASSKHCSSKKHEELGSSSKCRRSKKLDVHDSSSKCCSNKKLEDLGSSSKRSSSKKLGAGAGTGSGKRSTSRHKSSKHRTVVTFKEPSMNSRYNRAEKSVNADPAAEPGLASSGASSGLLQDENHKPASEVLENGSIKAVDVREAQPNAISREDGSSSSDSSDDEEKALNDLHNHRVFDNNKPSINPKLRHLRTR